MNNAKMSIPQVPFYFIRHGETDWNKFKQGLCAQDDITLNQTGLQQAESAIIDLISLGITKIYASPLTRATQTAQIINEHLNVSLETHDGLYAVKDDAITYTLAEILDPSHITLIVSHGEVYRILLRILEIQTTELNAKNCGVYLFKPPHLFSDIWTVHSIKLAINARSL